MMNKLGIQSKFLWAAVTLVTMGLSSAAQAAAGSAKATGVDGQVSYDAGSGAMTLTNGAKLSAGTLISTGPGSEVTLNFSGVGALRVGQNTVLRLTQMNSQSSGSGKVTDTQLDLQEGCLLGTVNKFASDLSKFDIKLPTGMVGIDAAEESVSFSVCATGGMPDVRVTKGLAVLVYTVGGNVMTQRISAGQGFNPNGPTPIQLSQQQLDDVNGNLPTVGPDGVSPVLTATRPFDFFISPSRESGGGGGE